MHGNIVGVTAGKGGVLKTTLACHLAGLAAAARWRTLLVDADPQGNAMFDLGYPSDGGKHLAAAITSNAELSPLRDVRPGLDVIPGGPALDNIKPSDNPSNWHRLTDALGTIAGGYDLIVIDAPARELHLRRMILTAARCVIIPTGVDRASRVGLPDAAATINEIRSTTNHTLDVLALVAGPLPHTHHRIRQRTRERLAELIGDPDLIAATIIRHAPLVAEQCREHGLLTTEYAEQITNRGPIWDRETTSDAAQGVADDWHHLTTELLQRFSALPDTQ